MKRIPRLKSGEKYEVLERALRQMTKPQLIAELMELAKVPECWRALEDRLDLQPETLEDLVARTKLAICDATDYEDRDPSLGLDYDYDAYERIKRYFKQVAKGGQLQAAMELAETLMADGSKQVEMSHEGLMWDDIEECLDIVFDAVEKSGLPHEQVAAWASRLEQNDRIGLYDRAEEFRKKPKSRGARKAGPKKFSP